MTPLVIAHRGASGRECENSLAAFRAAAALGADAVELDVHATADGAFVVHHDDSIGRLHIATTPLARVRERALPNGEPVPTLEDALACIVPGMVAFVEVKALDARFDERLAALLEPLGDRAAVHSFDHRIIKRLGDRHPALRRGILSSSYEIDPGHMIRDARAHALWQHASLVDAPLVASAREADAVVYAWTVDDPVRMRQLLDDGVAGLCSNHPDRARAAIDSIRP